MVNGGLPRTVKIERTIRYRLDLQIICVDKKNPPEETPADHHVLTYETRL
jgi:hypothetical protein